MRTALASPPEATRTHRPLSPPATGAARSAEQVAAPRSGHRLADVPVAPPRTPPTVPAVRTVRLRVDAAGAAADEGCRGTGAGPTEDQEVHRSAGVVPPDQDETGDTGVDGGAPVAPGPGPVAAATDCECCVDSVAVGNVTRIDTATRMGHSFDCTISLRYPATTASGGGIRPCRLEWWERTNVPYVAGQAAGTWNDMYALLPTSPTLAPWVNRGATCDTSQGVVIHDPPSLGRRAGRTVTRTLDFDIKVFSATGSGCATASRNATATQVLTMVAGAPNWAMSSFTTP